MYARDGEAMLSQLNGIIFAFAIWDVHASRLFLARDRLGVKPLYYAQRGDLLVFGSEIKALLPALPRPCLNEPAVADFLTFLWVPDFLISLHEGVHQLPAGYCATFEAGRLGMRQYWDASFDVDASRHRDEWRDDVRRTVSEAIRRQMVSDVPIGSFLSGGIDSSAIVAEMSAATGGRGYPPTRSGSAPRISAPRSCPTTYITPARSARSSTPSTTSRQSSPTSWISCHG